MHGARQTQSSRELARSAGRAHTRKTQPRDAYAHTTRYNDQTARKLVRVGAALAPSPLGADSAKSSAGFFTASSSESDSLLRAEGAGEAGDVDASSWSGGRGGRGYRSRRKANGDGKARRT